MIEADTLPKCLRLHYQKYGDRKKAFRHKVFGVWQSYNWNDYYESVKTLSLGLISLGMEPGHKVIIIGDSTPHWFYSEYAILAAHGVAVPIYSDASPAEVKYIANHSDTEFAIAGDQEQIDKFLQNKDEFPQIRKLIFWDSKGLEGYEDPLLMSFDKVRELGKEHDKLRPGLFEHNIEMGSGDDVAVIAYTSGTTGLPKGARITHTNLIWSGRAFLENAPLYENDDIVCALPPAWIAGQWTDLVGALLAAPVVNFPEDPETVSQNVREIGVTTIAYPTRLWEGIIRDVLARIDDASYVRRLNYRLLLPIGYRMADFYFAHKSPPLFWKALYSFAYRVLFSPLRDKLGLSMLRIGNIGGGLIGPDILRYFSALGMPLTEVYGITEGGAISASKRDDGRLETIGPPLLGVEVRLSDVGEILSRSPGVFTGYYKDLENTETRKVLDRGWFHTGDAGFLSEEGHLVFLDRVADLVELAGGEKIAPQFIETRLKFSPYLRDVMIIAGSDRPYVSAIMTIDFANVGMWATNRKISYTTYLDLSQKPEVHDLVLKEVRKLNKLVPQQSRIRKCVLLHKEFDPDEAELTRTRKLRRGFLEERYAELLDAIYGDKTEAPAETTVKYRDGRTGTVRTNIAIMSAN